MQNLGLPHPEQKMDIAVPANLRRGEPESGTPGEKPDWGPVSHTFAGGLEIDPQWVAEHRDRVTLLDVREAPELTGDLGSIEGIVHIPLGALPDRVGEVPRDKPVVCLCRSGRRSAQACVILDKAGVADVANLPGG